jgi:hypothetical protein
MARYIAHAITDRTHALIVKSENNISAISWYCNIYSHAAMNA